MFSGMAYSTLCKISHMHITLMKWYGLNNCWFSVAGPKLTWTKAYVTLKYYMFSLII